jgi:site-specific DNA-methyltransferase (adenine-specific)
VRLAEGEVVHVPQSDPAKRAGEVGRDLGFTGNDTETFQQAQRESIERTNTLGRWPANVILSHAPDCGEECAPGCPCAAMDAQSGVRTSGKMEGMQRGWGFHGIYGEGGLTPATSYGDTGGASRFFNQLPIEADDLVPFFYAAKASRSEREEGCDTLEAKPPPAAETKVSLKSPRAGAGRLRDTVLNNHPTVKPVSVMAWCLRLVVPPGGLVLDPFMGSGTTGVAAVREGFDFVGIEREAEYLKIAEARVEHARKKREGG